MVQAHPTEPTIYRLFPCLGIEFRYQDPPNELSRARAWSFAIRLRLEAARNGCLRATTR